MSNRFSQGRAHVPPLNVRSIDCIAVRMLAEARSPVVRYRLLRDVLRLGRDDARLRAAREDAMRSLRVNELAAEQRNDGSWGRFHSADSLLRQRVPTTEAAVERALDRGLDRSHPMLRKAVTYVNAILRGELPFPDPPEKNERWPTGVRLFCASTLARIDPAARGVDPVWAVWGGVLSRTFASGRFNAPAEMRAHRELSGIRGELRYLQIRNKYAVALLGSRAAELPPTVARAYCRYLVRHEVGLGYVEAPLASGPAGRRALGWFASMELTSRFAGWRDAARGAVRMLWHASRDDGTWDFGPVAPDAWLSENPRDVHARRHDWTLRALVLLRRYCDDDGRITGGLSPRSTRSTRTP